MRRQIKNHHSGKGICVSLCHRRSIRRPTCVEADGCMGYGNVIVFDKAEDVLVGDVLNW